MKIYEDGRYIDINTRKSWLKHRLFNIEDAGIIFQKAIQQCSDNSATFYLWPTTPSDHLLSALYENNIWHGISLYKRQGNYFESWDFSVDRQTPEILNFYLNNLALLQQFIEYFNEQVQILFKSLPPQKAAYFKKKINISPQETLRDSSILKDFFQKNFLKRPFLRVGQEKVFLSTQEFKCLFELAQGKTTKEVGKKLEISHRTVEKHLEDVKRKTNCKTKEVILAFYDQINKIF